MFRLLRYLSTKSQADLFQDHLSFALKCKPEDIKPSTLSSLVSLYNKAKPSLSPPLYWESSYSLYTVLNSLNIQKECDSIEDYLSQNLNQVPESTLVRFSGVVSNPITKTSIINFMNSNSELSRDCKINIAINLKNEEYLYSLLESKQLAINDFKLILSAIRFVKGSMLLLNLVKQGQHLFKQSNDLDNFLNLIESISLKNVGLAAECVPLIEEYLIATRIKFTHSMIERLMKLFKNPATHLNFSSEFKVFFEGKVVEFLENKEAYNPALYLFLFSNNEYYSEAVYSRLLKNFILVDPANLSIIETINTFYYISMVFYFDEELLNYFKICSLKFLNTKNISNTAKILRTMINQNFFPEDLLNHAMNCLIKSEIIETKSKFVEHSLKMLTIDRPELSAFVEDMLKKFNREEKSNYVLSKTHNNIKGVLNNFDLKFEESAVLHGLYEIDFLMKKEKIAIEAIGTVYHSNLTDKKISPKELARARHLVRLGYKVILSVNKESTEKFLKKGIFVLNNFKNQNVIMLMKDRIEVLNVLN